MNRNTLCYDTLSGRYFNMSSYDLCGMCYVFRIGRNINKKRRYTLNEWYELIRLPGIQVGDDLVWDSFSNIGDIDFEVNYDRTDDGTLLVVLNYVNLPIHRDFIKQSEEAQA